MKVFFGDPQKDPASSPAQATRGHPERPPPTPPSPPRASSPPEGASRKKWRDPSQGWRRPSISTRLHEARPDGGTPCGDLAAPAAGPSSAGSGRRGPDLLRTHPIARFPAPAPPPLLSVGLLLWTSPTTSVGSGLMAPRSGTGHHFPALPGLFGSLDGP
jgi:hypothetical protein